MVDIVLAKQSAPALITEAALDAYLGQSVEDFCSMFGKKGDVHNHCAHWVSHALGFRIGKLCNQMTFEHRKRSDDGRSLTVDALFNQCPERDYWDKKPDNLTTCLIFAVLPKGIGKSGGTLTMSAIANKHVGIYLNGHAYNYHNKSSEGVHKDSAQFFKSLYGSTTVVLYGTFPK
jgi:hypothetical protein